MWAQPTEQTHLNQLAAEATGLISRFLDQGTYLLMQESRQIEVQLCKNLDDKCAVISNLLSSTERSRVEEVNQLEMQLERELPSTHVAISTQQGHIEQKLEQLYQNIRNKLTEFSETVDQQIVQR